MQTLADFYASGGQATQSRWAIPAGQDAQANRGPSSYGEFMRTKPPVFFEAEPLEAEDCLRMIEKKLDLIRARDEDKGYLNKFTQLARYATSDIPDEGEKIDKFLGGLNDTLCGPLIIQDHASFQSMVNKALRSEQDNRKVEANRKRKAAIFQSKQPGEQQFKNVIELEASVSHTTPSSSRQSSSRHTSSLPPNPRIPHTNSYHPCTKSK
ncbi:hypothetical protein E2562_007462 [Oryza meyeriana var. granulata]|uniref:Retrotransposon gag domain-containing protein n=1 Tax=Oryza meyeriana var. granulata TaxID=110450 RepID=A0A6G1F514_9ORYZ|nr:hypothetical protein E2562_007462 [Oryza meyeriana var. granulata]